MEDKIITQINDNIFHIVSEPGDMTRYNYFVYVDFDDYWWVIICAAWKLQRKDETNDFSEFFKKCCYYSSESDKWIADRALDAISDMAIDKKKEWCLPFLEKLRKETKQDWLKAEVNSAIKEILSS